MNTYSFICIIRTGSSATARASVAVSDVFKKAMIDSSTVNVGVQKARGKSVDVSYNYNMICKDLINCV